MRGAAWARAGAAILAAGTAGGVLAAAVAPGPPPSVATVAQEVEEGPPYDGRFTFVRLSFPSSRGMRGSFFGGGRRGEPPWHHDRPRAEVNFAKIIGETTFVDVAGGSGRVLALDDPDLFRYPIAYIVEVGFWNPTDEEAAALRAWLLKGGFLIVDDFRGPDIQNFLHQMRRVLPELDVVELDGSHEIFDSFFRIEDPVALLPPPTFRQYVPRYLGIYEDNDPEKRLLAVINYNNDIAEYWEYSDYGYHPIALSNEAYKFGVNYLVYAMTH